ncbi:MAG: hypothetical protein ONB14_00575 [candidate division KSB1 bacterium]|nr:hypothetical protein [candidate division KSB1 bacterium]MDZ7378093.1 hypothetical protein [candidate division KSB1 bacterium]MDZ7384702.1 hypothetical protein [candidate division KSB1 bacterium]MDZ7392271.1 hypothetical protein [candidate division KSB1 bacterium]
MKQQLWHRGPAEEQQLGIIHLLCAGLDKYALSWAFDYSLAPEEWCHCAAR